MYICMLPAKIAFLPCGHAGRFSYSPQAGHLWSSFSAWWGDSLTRPRLDISGRRSARGGEILLLAPGWTSFNVRHVVAGDREQRTYIEIASKRERGREPERKSRDLNNRSLKTDKETESGGPT